MKIKKKVSVTNNTRLVELEQREEQLENKIVALLNEKELVQEEILSLKIKPFKIGDFALALVPNGRTKKEQKCLLESDHGVLRLRPLKKDGGLSNRSFSYYPITQSYQEYLKPVEE